LKNKMHLTKIKVVLIILYFNWRNKQIHRIL